MYNQRREGCWRGRGGSKQETFSEVLCIVITVTVAHRHVSEFVSNDKAWKEYFETMSERYTTGGTDFQCKMNYRWNEKNGVLSSGYFRTLY